MQELSPLIIVALTAGAALLVTFVVALAGRRDRSRNDQQPPHRRFM